MNPEEKILCAAIHFDDGQYRINQPAGITTGVVLCGHRHHNIFSQIWKLVSARKEAGFTEETQGFLTSKNRFVGRREPATIAQKQGQLKRGLDRVEILYSEDLY